MYILCMKCLLRKESHNEKVSWIILSKRWFDDTYNTESVDVVYWCCWGDMVVWSE